MILGVGIDVVDVERMKSLLTRRPKIVERLFSAAEQEYSVKQADPSRRLAVRFAAKEAVMKALSANFGTIGWKEVEVVRNEQPNPRPVEVQLTGRAAQLAKDQGVVDIQISLSHSDTTAIAIALAQ